MNTTNQQSNTNKDESPTDPKGAQLRQTLEHLALEKMIDQVKEQDLNHKELCKILHTCSEHKKADVAQEKTRSTERIAMQRLNKNHPPPKAPGNPETNPDSNATNPDHNGLPLRDPNSPQTQPGDLNDPNTNPTAQSHKVFCRNLAKAARDIWGVDISAVCKANGHYDDETDPTETEDLYDIPPEYQQGATPIPGSQQEYGQPKFTYEEWRRVMFRAIRENYGIYDEEPTPNDVQDKQHQPEVLERTGTIPPKSYQPRPQPLASSRSTRAPP